MKKLAKLAIFFSLSFIVIFLVGAGLRMLALRVDWLRQLPQQPEAFLTMIINAAHWACCLALYSSLLLTLSYAARKQFFPPMVTCVVTILSLCGIWAVVSSVDHMEKLVPTQFKTNSLGGPGLIISRLNTSVVLLEGAANPRSPRVTAITEKPGDPPRPLLYQAEPTGINNTVLDLPPLPFGAESPGFLRDLAIDIRLCTEQMRVRLEDGTVPFFAYALALICFLGSLGFIFRLSAWPLANMFIGGLAFRGVLALETFFNSPEMQDNFNTFIDNRIPLTWVVPIIFFGAAILVHIYSILVWLARRRSSDEEV